MAAADLMDRYWCPREAALPLTDDGYLLDPAAERRIGFPHDELARLDQLDGNRCLALLGEPGMGKSTVVAATAKSLDFAASSTKLMVRDLREYGTEDRIVRELFHSDQVRAWAADNESRLHLILDSLDECATRVPHVGALVAGQLRQLPTVRLNLWIVCRTGDWPLTLESVLVELYGDTFRVYEIAPLRRRDVLGAAADTDVDPPAFAAAVDDAGVGPLAAKPLTLRFLLNRFRESAALPSSQAELYAEGVQQLCTETSTTRFDAGATGDLSPRERVAVAARLAAVAWLCQKPVVRVHNDGSPPGQLETSIDDLAVDSEPLDGATVVLRPQTVREVLGTGLFSSRGPARFGWAHESYGEFLAATFLRRRLTDGQVIRLLTTSATGSLRVVPQLREVAAWAVAIAPGLETLIEADPEAIANAGVGLDTERLRSLLVDALLATAGGPGLRREFGVDYRRLRHRKLGAQLGAVLMNPTAPVAARELATQIARDTGTNELAGALGDIALDGTAPPWLRIRAAYALADIGDDDARRRLKPLATGGDDDPDDELKGVALGATWPWAFEDEELFAPLRRPKRSNFLGAYRMFMARVLPERVGPHLASALDWLASRSEQELESFDDLAEALAREAWQRVAERDVCRGLAQVIFKTIIADRDTLSRLLPLKRPTNYFDVSDGDRRLVLMAIIALADRDDVMSIVHSYPHIAQTDDFAWFMEQRRELGQTAPPALDAVVGNLFSPLRVDHSEIASMVPSDDPLYRDFFAYWFEPMALESAPAVESCRRRRPVAEMPVESAAAPVGEEELRDRITRELDAFEAGDVDGWWRCCFQLMLAPGDAFFRNDREFEPDLTALPGWAAATPADRNRLVESSRSYLERGDPRVDEWWDTDSIWRPALAGYKAMALLLGLRPDTLEALEPEIWARWLDVVYRFPHFQQAVGDNDVQRSLLGMAVPRCPDAAADVVRRLVIRASQRQQSLFERRLVDGAWDPAVAAALADEVEAAQLHDAVDRDVLSLLLNHGDERAELLAARRLDFDEGYDEERAVDAAVELLGHDPVRWWPLIWDRISKSSPFGRRLISQAATSYEFGELALPLPPDALADLYLWLATEFPESTDPQLGSGHFVGPREQIARFRDGILSRLERHGTIEALVALRRVVTRRSDAPWLQHTLLSAEAIVRRESWQPLSAEALLALAARPSARVVQSDVDLLDLVVEQVESLRTTLQGQTPMARFLWDESQGSPKSEDAISDYVAAFLRRHLREAGVVVNREVEVRRVPGAPVGERTDIQVEAAIQTDSGPVDVITVVVEVKGNWNRELLTAMDTQLWNRYMKDIGTNHGVYLVAWFGLAGWAHRDDRRTRVAALSAKKIEHQLRASATKLSPEGADIRVVVLDVSLPQRRT